jgi:4-amino-4-deoxy-L-arabinose transferase-like glycosyltransferase
MSIQKDPKRTKTKYLLTIERLLRILTLIFGALVAILYIWVALSRMNYPFDLEWIEGGMTEIVRRILIGQSMYVPPSVNFTPFLYPPVYFYLTALVAKFTGFGFFPLRLVSFSASCISGATIFAIIRRETRNDFAAIIAACLFFAMFYAAGAWLDIARVDSLFLAFILLTFYFIPITQTGYALLAGLFAALAILTKQTALIICLPLALYLFVTNWKRGLIFSATTALIVGIVTLWFNIQSDGWYVYYVFTLLNQQTEWLIADIFIFWNRDLIAPLGIATLLSTFYLLNLFFRDRKRFFFWTTLLIGCFLGSYLTRVKVGGAANVLLPLYAVLAILFALGINEIFALNPNPIHKNLLYIAILFQFISLSYNPFAQIPTPADIKAGNGLVKYISSVNGEVYIPDHTYLSSLANKQSFAHFSAVWDVTRGDVQDAGKTMLTNDLASTICHQQFAAIIVDDDWYYLPGLETYYTYSGPIPYNGNVFFPVTGRRSRPMNIYIPNKSVTCP